MNDDAILAAEGVMNRAYGAWSRDSLIYREMIAAFRNHGARQAEQAARAMLPSGPAPLPSNKIWQCPKCKRWNTANNDKCLSEYDTGLPCDGVPASGPADRSPFEKAADIEAATPITAGISGPAESPAARGWNDWTPAEILKHVASELEARLSNSFVEIEWPVLKGLYDMASGSAECERCGGTGSEAVSREPCSTARMDCLRCKGTGYQRKAVAALARYKGKMGGE